MLIIFLIAIAGGMLGNATIQYATYRRIFWWNVLIYGVLIGGIFGILFGLFVE